MIIEQPYRLLLYPLPGELQIIDAAALIQPLTDIGFLGEAIEPKMQGHYYVGDRFMDLLTFLGCSPDIALSPEDGENYCHIRIHAVSSAYRLFSGRNTREPLCRQCRRPQPDWPRVCDNDYCDDCTLLQRTENMVWKKSAALARTAVEVRPVYPHEAVPSEELMDALQQSGAIGWSHAYL